MDDLTVDGALYLDALAAFIRLHERKLAEYVRQSRTASPSSSSGNGATGPMSWFWPAGGSSGSSSSSSSKDTRLILKIDPHHLYYLLLKFDELAIPGIGDLDTRLESPLARPLSYVGVFDDAPAPQDGGDTHSIKSSFSIASTLGSIGSATTSWWRTGGENDGEIPSADATSRNVLFVYASCTKLPALRIGPFKPDRSPVPSSSTRKRTAALAKTVRDFDDCPPSLTCVPLHSFKNLQALALQDVDPRAFTGWLRLSVQLRSLELSNSGLEDVGHLLCDYVVRDVNIERAKRRAAKDVAAESGIQQDNGGATDQDDDDDGKQAYYPSEESGAPTYPIPPRAAWSQLGHLSLSRNALTFIPSAPMTHLPALTSLDLSSNLLNAVPPALSHLYSLRSLNLADNMIESTVGIWRALGNVQTLNLSRNRLESLSGLDRLLGLERLDVRENRVAETLEVSRVAPLPLLRELHVAGNDFVQLDGEHCRAKIFAYFAAEGNVSLVLDGALPSSRERRAMAAVHRKSPPSRSAAPEPPERTSASAPTAESSTAATPVAVSSIRPRRRPPRRIVNLNDDDDDDNNNNSNDPEISSESERARHFASMPSRSPAGKMPPATTTVSKGSKRRARVSASLYEPHDAPRSSSPIPPVPALPTHPTSSTPHVGPSSSSTTTSSPAPAPARNSDAFRQQIEALRAEVGESWLSVLSEREAVAAERARLAAAATNVSASAEAAPAGAAHVARGEERNGHGDVPTREREGEGDDDDDEGEEGKDGGAAGAAADVRPASPAASNKAPSFSGASQRRNKKKKKKKKPKPASIPPSSAEHVDERPTPTTQ